MERIYFDDPEKIGEYVRYYRKQKNLTQAQLAAAVGTSRSAISSLEKHSYRLSLGVMMNIADYLGMPMDFVFKSDKIYFLRKYIVGKTTVSADGKLRDFGNVQICSDFINDDTMICVFYKDKFYIADTANLHRSKRLLCANKTTGHLFVTYKSKMTQEKYDESIVIAAIISKDMTSSVIANEYLF